LELFQIGYILGSNKIKDMILKLFEKIYFEFKYNQIYGFSLFFQEDIYFIEIYKRCR